MEIRYLGHSTLYLTLENQTKILVDPFVRNNPLTQWPLEKLTPEYILCTHGHNDHIDDAKEIALKNNSLVIGMAELATWLEKDGVKTHGMNIGGQFTFPFGKVKMVEAKHSSSFTTEEGEMVYLGEAAGYVLQVEGKTLYFAGDTAYFSDMKLLKEDFQIDWAFIPIGDNFTMGIKDAVKCSEAIGAKQVVPIHYNTFPVIQQNPEEFKKALPKQAVILSFDEAIEL